LGVVLVATEIIQLKGWHTNAGKQTGTVKYSYGSYFILLGDQYLGVPTTALLHKYLDDINHSTTKKISRYVLDKGLRGLFVSVTSLQKPYKSGTGALEVSFYDHLLGTEDGFTLLNPDPKETPVPEEPKVVYDQKVYLAIPNYGIF
jgi:hypothetical protein